MFRKAKRLEGALVAKHHLPYEDQEKGDISQVKQPSKRSLRGRSSLRLSRDDRKGGLQRKTSKGSGPSRTWSSIEAIVSAEEIAKVLWQGL